MQGKVIFWNYEKGFGFIQPDDLSSGGDIFFHKSGLPTDGDDPAIGQRVSFETGMRQAKLIALNIKFVESSK